MSSLQACELVKRNVDRYHRHMSTVRDYLEKQLEVSRLSAVINIFAVCQIDAYEISNCDTLKIFFQQKCHFGLIELTKGTSPEIQNISDSNCSRLPGFYL
jgi:hypothetical protein